MRKKKIFSLFVLGEGSTFHFTIASNMRIARQHQASHDMQEELHQKRVTEVQRSFAGKTALVLVKVWDVFCGFAFVI